MDKKKYTPTDKGLRAIDLLFRSDVNNYDYLIGAEPCTWQIESFVRQITSWDYGIYDVIDFNEEFFDYLKTRDICFTQWLLRLGYITVENNIWNFSCGDWIIVGWKDIQEFQPGVMLNRILSGKNNVMKIKNKPYWRTTSGDRELLSIDVFCKSRFTLTGYQSDHYYLSDLFRGDSVFMQKIKTDRVS